MKQPWLSVEEILNHAGVYGISVSAMVEIRAGVYYPLDRGLTAAQELKEALGCFIFDHPVFRWSELRFYFKGDLKNVLTDLLKTFKYKCRYLEELGEFIWVPVRMWHITARH